MGFRFRKKINIAPGVNINISKSGISTSLGKPGATMNIGKSGVRTTAGIPGTGLSWSKKISRERQSDDMKADVRNPGGVVDTFLGVLTFAFFVGCIWVVYEVISFVSSILTA